MGVVVKIFNAFVVWPRIFFTSFQSPGRGICGYFASVVSFSMLCNSACVQTHCTSCPDHTNSGVYNFSTTLLLVMSVCIIHIAKDLSLSPAKRQHTDIYIDGHSILSILLINTSLKVIFISVYKEIKDT